MTQSHIKTEGVHSTTSVSVAVRKEALSPGYCQLISQHDIPRRKKTILLYNIISSLIVSTLGTPTAQQMASEHKRRRPPYLNVILLRGNSSHVSDVLWKLFKNFGEMLKNQSRYLVWHTLWFERRHHARRMCYLLHRNWRVHCEAVRPCFSDSDRDQRDLREKLDPTCVAKYNSGTQLRDPCFYERGTNNLILMNYRDDFGGTDCLCRWLYSMSCIRCKSMWYTLWIFPVHGTSLKARVALVEYPLFKYP